MKKKTKSLGAIGTFKALLLLSGGKAIGSIQPYRLKSSPEVYAGFECLTAREAQEEGVDIPKDMRPEDTVYMKRIGPAILREWMPAWMFEAAFERIPDGDCKDRGQTLGEKIQASFATGQELNRQAYALSVELLSQHGGCLRAGDDDEQQCSAYIPVENRDPVELVIREASVGDDGKIIIKGYSYYTSEEFEWECDTGLGTDILDFILSNTGQTD